MDFVLQSLNFLFSEQVFRRIVPKTLWCRERRRSNPPRPSVSALRTAPRRVGHPSEEAEPTPAYGHPSEEAEPTPAYGHPSEEAEPTPAYGHPSEEAENDPR